MTNLLITTLGILAGLCLYAGMSHLQIGWQRPRNRAHLLFGVLSVIVAWYVCAKLGAYRAVNAEELVASRRWEISVAALFFVVFPWFVAQYTGMRQILPPVVLSASWALLLAADLALPYGVSYNELPALQHLTLPWGERVVDLRANEHNGWQQLGWLSVLLSFAYGVYACARQYQRGDTRQALSCILGLSVFFVFVLFNLVVNSGVVQFTHTAEFGFVALILLMNSAWSRELQAGSAALRASDARFRTLVEQSPLSIQVLALDGRPLLVNSSWEKLWGTTLAALGNYSVIDDRQLLENGVAPYLKRAFAGEVTEIPPIVYHPQQTDGVVSAPVHDRWVRAFAYPVRDALNQVREVIFVQEDITESNQTQEALAMLARTSSAIDSDEFFRSAARNLAQAYSAHFAFIGILRESKQDVRTLAVWAGDRFAANFEYHLDGTPCKDILDLRKQLIPRDAARLYPDDTMLVKMGVESYFGAPLIASNGETLGLVSVMDVKPMALTRWTAPILGIFASRIAAELQQIKAEQRLQRSETRLAALLDIAPGAIISIDAQQNIIVFNREAQHIFGYSADELLGQPLDRLMPERHRLDHRDAVIKFKNESDNVRRMMGRPTIMAVRKNGEEFPAEASISKITLDGEPVYTVALQDISERQRRDQELRRHREHLEELVTARTVQLAAANKELESFSYSVSHDLRAPLRAIQGFSAAVIEDCSAQIDPRCASYLARIQSATEKMSHLIDDLLQLSRITRAEMQRTSVDLCVLAHPLVDSLQQRDPQRRVEFVCPAALPVSGDARLLTIALDNLLENAWKFTRNRSTARIELGQQDLNSEHVYYVRDNGAGFDMNYADKLFNAFQRLHTDQQFEGTGVGLSIVQRIIHRHGGRIWAQAQQDLGATFYFTLPSAPDNQLATDPIN